LFKSSVYSGSFVTLAKEEYSNGKNANLQKWQHYIKNVVGHFCRKEYK
jgi:hypothetical protein